MKHWLMKSEPDAFGIADLQRVGVEPWTGVRNYQARNLMRDQMQVGDAVLFYHSSVDPPGVAGLARVVKTGVVDPTQFDPGGQYFDPRSKRDAPTWVCVEVEFVEAFPELVPLPQLRTMAGLEDMMLLRKGSRLSVQPVTAREYTLITRAARSAHSAAPRPGNAQRKLSPGARTT
jgi:predicted RNA-binding protein with PUA-like domain